MPSTQPQEKLTVVGSPAEEVIQRVREMRVYLNGLQWEGEGEYDGERTSLLNHFQLVTLALAEFQTVLEEWC